MSTETIAIYEFGALRVEYLREGDCVGLSMVPAARAEERATHREHLSGEPAYSGEFASLAAAHLDPLVHCHLLGRAMPGAHSGGRMLHGAPSGTALRYAGQEHEKSDDVCTVTTRLEAPGYACRHVLTWRRDEAAVQVYTVFENTGDAPLELGYLTSFNLGGITPFVPDDAAQRLTIHRPRANWSGEARWESRLAEELHMERTWAGFMIVGERWGQIGSMPTRGWFPFVAIEDHVAGVTWAAQVACPGSWQLELVRQDDFMSIAGGQADFEFGHWHKTIAPGAEFVSPMATLGCVSGDLDDVAAALLTVQERARASQPAVENDLPIVFNEWCTSWGKPYHADLVRLADRLAQTPVRYLVIDAGWYCREIGNWGALQGDWLPNSELYPDGLAATAAAIRARGLIPGLWFEFEVVGERADAIRQEEHFLHRHGAVLNAGNRRFWDFRDPWVHDYLGERVIGLLRDCGFGYLKTDYNETIGIGCDGAESPGEGLRQHLVGVLDFWHRIRQELPELVIEACASGGQRLEPSFLAIAAQGSSSDAHESRDIPIIAANLQRLVLPAQCQVWATLRADADHHRLGYLLAGGFLGRLCLSGDIVTLDNDQFAFVQEGLTLYGQVAPIIRHGVSRRYGPSVVSYRHATGWQAVRRIATDGQEALIVVHSFAPPSPNKICVPLPPGEWHIAAHYTSDPNASATLEEGCLHVPIDGPWRGSVTHLTRRPLAQKRN